MTTNTTFQPTFILTQFERNENIQTIQVPEADGLEKFGNFACGLLHLSFGKHFEIKEIKMGYPFDNELQFTETKTSLITRIFSIALFILIFPVSIPLTIAGVISLSSSKSYADIFGKVCNVKYKNLEVDPYMEKCETKQDALNHISINKYSGADLRHYKDLNNEDLEFLAVNCPELKYLRVQGENISKIPDAFKNLQILECRNTSVLELPKDSSKLHTLMTHSATIGNWPSTLVNLNTLYVMECCTGTLPPDLSKLKNFNFKNTNSISQEELDRLPACFKKKCGEWPKDFEFKKF